jgi:hypothetical protein
VTPGHLLLAYHGCDASTRDDLVTRRLSTLEHSRNEYDWHGPGIYFFEGDPQRALGFAKASARRPEAMFTKRPIATPAVVGAVICAHSCLDMTVQKGLDEFEQTLEQLESLGTPLAVNEPNRPLLRKLNNQVFTSLHAVRSALHYAPYQLVRGAFVQGAPLGDSHSGFNRDNHIQIALCDPNAILGWFVPKGDRLMTTTEYVDARAALNALPIGAARKPRRRASI